MINGQAHGPQRGTATCQLHMRKFADGDTIVVEPWRAAAFPIIRDLDGRPRRRSTASSRPAASSPSRPAAAPDANLIPIPKRWPTPPWTPPPASAAAPAWRPARTAAAKLFTSAKVAHLNLLPQGQAERYSRTEAMVDTMEELFGSCTNHGECQAACPKEISIDFIALMNKDYLRGRSSRTAACSAAN